MSGLGLYRDAKHFYSWNGEPAVPGITSVIGALDKPALVGWAKRETAMAAVRNHAAVAQMVAQSPVNEETLAYHPGVAYLKAMPGYQRDSAADVGTRLHAWAEAWGKGESPEVDEDIRPWAASLYRGFFEMFKPNVIDTEFMVYHKGEGIILPYGGTMDLLCEIDGELWLIDYKTSKGVYPETALQLAAGQYAQFIGRPDDGTEYPLPMAPRHGVVWVRPEGTSLVEYDITPREFQAFAAARMAWDWVHNRSKQVIGETL